MKRKSLEIYTGLPQFCSLETLCDRYHCKASVFQMEGLQLEEMEQLAKGSQLNALVPTVGCPQTKKPLSAKMAPSERH